MIKELENINLYIFDLDGTIYIGNKEIVGAFDTIRKLRAMGKQICFFTNNSSRNHNDYIKKFADMGLSISENEIYTSGQATCEWLVDNYKHSKVFLLGNPALQTEFIEYGITLDEKDPDICVVAFDTSLEYGRVYNFCKKLYQHKEILYVATHPDESCPAEECPMPDVGSIIDLVKDTIGRAPDTIIGKPFISAGERIQKRFNASKENIAMVGDRLNTDIAFGNNCGFKSILVLSGETDKDMLSKSKIKPSMVLNSVKDIVR